jgi:hypothetical protein
MKFQEKNPRQKDRDNDNINPGKNKKPEGGQRPGQGGAGSQRSN